MARPIRETPILFGEDARRFEEEMRRVDNLSAEERKANREKLRKQCEEFRRKLIIKIQNTMELIQLTTDYELKPFDCGDADLNGREHFIWVL